MRSAVHGSGSWAGQASSSALAAARAASSWASAGAASLIAAWTAEVIRTVGGVTFRSTLIRPARSTASSVSQAGPGSVTVENGVAAPPRYVATADVLKTAPGIP